MSDNAVFPSNDALALLEQTYSPEIDPDALNANLRKAGHAPGVIVEVVNQVALRQKARQKLGPLADSLLLTRQGLEQSSRIDVAKYHARKLSSLGSVTDLGCGLGIDSIALAESGSAVVAVEKDEMTAKFASYNLARFPTAEVHRSAAEDFDVGTEGVFLDPARRDLGASGRSRKLLSPEDFSPSISFAFEQLSRMPGGVKLSPALPHELVSDKFDATWVSHRGDLVEFSQWSTDPQHFGKRFAVMIDGETELKFTGEEFDAEVSSLDEYVYEPDPALIRSHLLGAFALEEGLGLLSQGIAYLTGSERKSPWLRGYKLLAEMPLDEKAISRYLSERRIGSLEIKKRGVDIDPQLMRKRLKLKGSGAATLIATKVGGARKALVCEPIR
ncbi:class I SAM-dependent methyltransferase [Aquiluna sp.]|nr:class I SAM-dependent methyltransferase [Aquiluna sp.]